MGKPDGVKVYPPDVTTADKANRGDLVGERRETITYRAQQPGTVVLPALTCTARYPLPPGSPEYGTLAPSC